MWDWQLLLGWSGGSAGLDTRSWFTLLFILFHYYEDVAFLLLLLGGMFQMHLVMAY